MRNRIKSWVVKNARVTNPYSKEKWYASITIGYDYNGEGTSIEKAYGALTDKIYGSPFILNQLRQFKSFNKI